MATIAHFTLGIKTKIEFKLNIPIGAIIKVNFKGFTLWIKAKKENNFLKFNILWP